MCPLESRHQWHQAGTGQHWRSLRTETGGRRAQGRPGTAPTSRCQATAACQPGRVLQLPPASFLQAETCGHSFVGPVTCLELPAKGNRELHLNEK